MPRQKFMIDIETTGIQPDIHELMQVGLLEMQWNKKMGFWDLGKQFQLTQHTDRKPTSEFAIKNQQELYRICNEKEFIPKPMVRELMLAYFASCGATSPNIFLCGKNAAIFDVPFLTYHQYLRKDGYKTVDGKDINIADVHYRIYEMSSAIEFCSDVTGITDRDDLLDRAFKAYPEIEVPLGKEHFALPDCFTQVRQLNGLIRLARTREM